METGAYNAINAEELKEILNRMMQVIVSVITSGLHYNSIITITIIAILYSGLQHHYVLFSSITLLCYSCHYTSYSLLLKYITLFCYYVSGMLFINIA